MDGASYPQGSPGKESRPPRRSDLSRIAGELNRLGAKYLVVGGFAIIEAGYPRFTGDIDLLIDASRENEALVFEALRFLPDKAVNQLDPGDVGRFTVVRVADEVVVDLMANSCGVEYATAIRDAVYSEIDGVRIPFASPATLWKMKQTVREKDIPDRIFLRNLLEKDQSQESPLQARRWSLKTALWILTSLLAADVLYVSYFFLFRRSYYFPDRYEDAFSAGLNAFLAGIPLTITFAVLLTIHLCRRSDQNRNDRP